LKQDNEEARKSSNSSPQFTNTRRDFIKLFSAATMGGVSSLLLPSTSEAEDSLGLLDTGVLHNVDNELFWNFVRMQFVLKPGLIYMNTGTEGSMPRRVLSRLKNYFNEFAEDPWAAAVEHDCYNYFMKAIVEKVAGFLGTDSDEIVMTTNTTEGMGFAACALDLQEGDEVLTTLHFSPYNACWFVIQDRRNIKVTELELTTPATSKEEIIDSFAQAITPQTKVMSFCHINFSTGLRMPVMELCQLARENGIITLVDGAHAIGMLDYDLHELGCDLYACSPHKWLCAPPGTGVLYMRKEVQDQLTCPPFTEAYGARGTVRFQIRGQQCTPASTGVMDAIDLQEAIGKAAIEKRVLFLSTYLKEKIMDNWGEESLYSPLDEELSTGLVSCNPFDERSDPQSISDLVKALRQEHNIVTRSINFKDKHSDARNTPALRVSTHIYNSANQIEELISTVNTIIANS
jgi:selenocysteine lyase/cysteine desulfurase